MVEMLSLSVSGKTAMVELPCGDEACLLSDGYAIKCASGSTSSKSKENLLTS